jgi:hypothetical protein
VTTLRPFLLGLLLALVLVLIALAAEGYHAGQLFWLGLLPVLALHAAAVFTPIAGYRRRLVRGALGFLAAAAVGYSTYLYLLERTDWFRNMSGWIILIIVLHAAIPGGAAAAADSPRRGPRAGGRLQRRAVRRRQARGAPPTRATCCSSASVPSSA